MKNISLSERLRYAFDNYMAKGTVALVAGLGLVSLVFVGLITTLLYLLNLGPDGMGYPGLLWTTISQALTPNPVDFGAGGPWFLAGMFLITLAGVFMVSAFVGILNNGIEDKLDDLRKGRSHVIEENHTVILGWSSQVFAIIHELVIANANQKRARIVILGDKDKVEMEDEIRDRVGSTGNTAVVCRTGSPIDPGDLKMVSIQASKSIIVLAPDDDDEPDSNVIKTILAIVNNPDRRPEPYHIVAEIRDPRNMEVARMVGKAEAELVLVGDLISRITVQTCRQSGLSVIYTELLDFDGDEIYFQAESGLTGRTFGEALFAYEDSAVIGLRRAHGGVQLNPPMDTPIAADDKVIAISKDDDTIRLSGLTDFKVNTTAVRAWSTSTLQPERTLILGWNWRLPTIVNELDDYVAAGSTVTLMSDKENGEELIRRECGTLRNLNLEYRAGDTTDRRTLDDLDIPSYNHAILLCSDELDQQKADAHTLITLLHVRDIVDRSGRHVTVVSEMLDIRNRNLAEVARADDFIVSEKLVSLMLSQISENKELNAVFSDLFDPEGSEIYLKPVTDYVTLGGPLNFYTIIEAARRRGEVAIGYRILALANDAAHAYGVRVNPRKSDQVNFVDGDRIIVVAEN